MAWFETWFDTPYYHILYKDRDFAEAEHFITLLIEHLKLVPPARIIDLACGKGRHSVFLNKMGFEVLGVDLSKQSIAHNAQFENETLKFKVHDMRNALRPALVAQPVDAILNLFTSFGYFEKSEDDRNVFRSISDALAAGGYFVLDFLNADWVQASLVPHETKTKDGITFSIDKKIENRHVIKDITFTDKGQSHHYFEKVKLHTLEEINRYAEEVGLERVEIFGDYQLSEFASLTSPRCINVFRKKNLS